MLQDAADPRLQAIVGLKTRTQMMLHNAITLLVSIDDKSEDAIDSIKMAISTSKNIMTCHPMDRGSYASVKCVIMYCAFDPILTHLTELISHSLETCSNIL